MSGGLSAAMSAALSGIDAFQEGITTIGTNIANQTTPGYAIRSLAPETADAGAGQAGSGVVDPAAVLRAGDQFAALRLNAATSANQGAQTLSSALSGIDQALQGNGDVQTAATAFFSGLQSLASDPTNAALGQTVIADAQTLANSFNSAAQALTSQASGLSTTLAQNVGSANTLLGQLAGINQALQSDPDGNSLLDQQQAALNSLSGLIGIQTTPLANGAVEVTSNGAVLLDISGAQNLAIQQATPQSQPTLTAGAFQAAVRTSSGSGSIGAGIAGFSQTQGAQNSLDFLAGTLAGLVNQSQAEGLTGSGQAGAPLFSVPPPSVVANAANTGSATLTATVTNAAALPSGGQGYVFSFAASGWTATVPGTSQSIALGAGPTLAVAGLAVTVTGTPNIGDTFVVNPQPGAASDIALATSDPAALAAADPYVATPGTVGANGAVTNTNAGTESEASDTVTSTPASGAAIVPGTFFGQNLTLTFTSPTAYTISDAAGATVTTGTWSNGTNVAIGYPSASLAAGQFWQTTLTGQAATGDVISLTPGGPNSGSNATRMANILTQPSSLPGGSLQGAILSVVSQTGSQASAATQLATGTASDLTTAQNNLAAVAGVNQDQQAVLLTQYQQAFQAAAQVISTTQSMFESLITAVQDA
jgi:flagellar hook-associated protein 1